MPILLETSPNRVNMNKTATAFSPLAADELRMELMKVRAADPLMATANSEETSGDNLEQ